MTYIVDLPPKVEQAYLAQAQARGLPVGDVLRETLVAAQPADEEPVLSPEEWIREYEAWGERNAHKNLPFCPTKRFAGNPFTTIAVCKL